MAMTINEWLHEMEFEAYKDKQGYYHLIDLQGANLGGIEGETFLDIPEIIGRMDAYIHDYFVVELFEPFNKENEDIMDDFEGSEFDFADIYHYIKDNPRVSDYVKDNLRVCAFPEEVEDDTKEGE